MARLGVLALQGDFAAHLATLRELGLEAVEVRRCQQIEALSGLVLPGAESTTLLHLMSDEPWFETLRRFHADGGALFGTCAGAILLARQVQGRSQESLGVLDAVIERNAYGRQVDSFETTLDAPALGGGVPAVFIRAPRFVTLGPEVEVLARHRDQPVLVRQGRVLAATFHPEVAAEGRLHRLFADLADQGQAVSA